MNILTQLSTSKKLPATRMPIYGKRRLQTNLSNHSIFCQPKANTTNCADAKQDTSFDFVGIAG